MSRQQISLRPIHISKLRTLKVENIQLGGWISKRDAVYRGFGGQFEKYPKVYSFFDAKQLLFFYLDTQNILGTLSTGEVEHEVAGDLRAIST